MMVINKYKDNLKELPLGLSVKNKEVFSKIKLCPDILFAIYKFENRKDLIENFLIILVLGLLEG